MRPRVENVVRAAAPGALVRQRAGGRILGPPWRCSWADPGVRQAARMRTPAFAFWSFASGGAGFPDRCPPSTARSPGRTSLAVSARCHALSVVGGQAISGRERPAARRACFAPQDVPDPRRLRLPADDLRLRCPWALCAAASWWTAPQCPAAARSGNRCPSRIWHSAAPASGRSAPVDGVFVRRLLSAAVWARKPRGIRNSIWNGIPALLPEALYKHTLRFHTLPILRPAARSHSTVIS